MATVVLVLLSLTIGLMYTSAQVSLIQPDSVSTTPGKTVILNCTVHGISLSKKYVYWYHQKRDSAPRFILYGIDNRGDGIPDRFTGLEDEKTNIGHLTIANVESEDAGDYYCLSQEESSHCGRTSDSFNTKTLHRASAGIYMNY